MSQLERKKTRIGAVLLALVVILLGALVIQNYQASEARDTAQSSAATSAQQKKNLAEEVADACQSGQVVMGSAGVDLCTRAATIAKQPVTIEGPQGPAGPRGLPGIDGARGELGKTGTTGTAGANGTDGPAGATGADGGPGPNGIAGINGISGVDGSNGQDGLTGAAGANGPVGPTGQPGPAGPKGEPGTPGINGTTGAAGTNGRGITKVECVGIGQESHWLITYTDSTSEQSSGPCRLNPVEAPVDPEQP